MRKLLTTTISLLLFAPLAAFANGLISIESAGGSVEEVANRFEAALKEKGLKLFIRVNHAEGAKGVNLELGPTELLIFGNPKVGTPLIQCDRTTGIDLPQKALIWEDDDGQVWITYNDPQYLGERHGITEACAETIAKVGNALSGVANAAADPTTPTATEPEEGKCQFPAVNMTEVPDLSKHILKLQTVTVEKSMTFNNVELIQNAATGLFAISQFEDHHIDTSRTQLNGGQVNPPVSSQGSAFGLLNVDLVTGEIAGTVHIAGLSDVTTAHIHQGAVGENGGVVIPLEGDHKVRTIAKGTKLEQPDQLNAYVGGELYFNVHTKENPKGELRGQIIPFANQTFVSVTQLSGAQVVPDEIDTTASGVGVLHVNLSSGDISGYIVLSDLPDVTAAHIHQGARGENGGVIVPLEANDDKTRFSVPEGTVLTPEQLVSLLKEPLYFNAHTTEHPAGAIRGQIERVVD